MPRLPALGTSSGTILLTAFLLASCTAAPHGASDPDRRVAGGGAIVPGWRVRTDSGEPADNVRFVDRGGGFEVSVGPGSILYHPEHTASGAYTLRARVTQLDSKGHVHGAGLIFGGRDLAGPDQVYTYFLVRGDGCFIVKTRTGAETHLLSDRWVPHRAIRKQEWNGQAENLLEVEVGAEETVFRANGGEVFRHATDRLYHEGTYGLRLNHNLDMFISRPELLPSR